MDTALRAELDKVIRENFPAGTVESVEFSPAEISDDGATMKIFIILAAQSEPKNVAKHYFGLTGKVREKLRGQWQDFFPVITPVFNEGAHA
jgi:hypothetical protein